LNFTERKCGCERNPKPQAVWTGDEFGPKVVVMYHQELGILAVVVVLLVSVVCAEHSSENWYLG